MNETAFIIQNRLREATVSLERAGHSFFLLLMIKYFSVTDQVPTLEIFMNETAFIIQNRLREATVSLERAGLIRCGADWACSASIPPFSSIGLILEGTGTICVDGQDLHPRAGQLYLLPAKSSQSFSTDLVHPYRKYFCHFELGTGTICVDGQDLHPRAGQLYLLPAKSSQSFSTDLVHPYRKYFCHFELTCQNEELFDLIRMPLCTDAKDCAYAEKLFIQMQEACQGSDIFSALKSKQLLLELVCCYMESCPPGTISLIKHSFDSPLSDAVAYVEEHLNENVTVREMAELVCCYMESCPPGTISLIKHSFDSPLSDAVAYVEEHLNENVTVREMAEAAGYHASHFTP